jgi:hypothetical protein
MDVYLGTNETHFERLENPPAYVPTRCRVGHQPIRLGEDSDGRPATLSVGAVARRSNRSREVDKVGAGDPPISLRLRGNGYAV